MIYIYGMYIYMHLVYLYCSTPTLEMRVPSYATTLIEISLQKKTSDVMVYINQNASRKNPVNSLLEWNISDWNVEQKSMLLR